VFNRFQDVGIGQSFIGMSEADKDNANPSCIINPWVAISG